VQRSRTAWVFGYGSLIYKVDFPYLRREVASISGWTRRFWQGSHDHRGTPDAPGRVVTLIETPGALCRGVAYLVDADTFDHLDHREKNGYRRHEIPITLTRCHQVVTGMLYVASRDNHAYLGPAAPEVVAAQITVSHGPSGSNRDYLLRLAAALRELGEEDTHIAELERLVRHGGRGLREPG